ncbi:hypothetical protein B0H19DRAFT_438376 [Mycena capillaripes]|nr:hypothetical protein B0H19DRAFT_438376 [Mycena capillaripes]
MHVAAFAGRQMIARLCAVSHAFYSTFAAILYRNMTSEPPLSWRQTHFLVRTLCESHDPLTFKPHPMQLIRNLCLPGISYPPTILSQCRDGLRNLLETSPSKVGLSGQLVHGAALHALKWDSDVGIDTLARLLLAPGYFPNLKELAVKCDVERENTCFDFIRVPDLEKLECILSFGTFSEESKCVVRRPCWCAHPYTAGYKEWVPSWSLLRQTLGFLHLSSPLLQALILKIKLRAYKKTADTWDVDPDLVAALNQLRFSALTSLEFSLYTSWSRLCGPAPDFSPVLLGNPLIKNVTLNMEGVEGVCITPVADVSFLSNLVSFTDSVKNCAAVSAHAPGLRHITIYFPASTFTTAKDPCMTRLSSLSIPVARCPCGRSGWVHLSISQAPSPRLVRPPCHSVPEPHSPPREPQSPFESLPCGLRGASWAPRPRRAAERAH